MQFPSRGRSDGDMLRCLVLMAQFYVNGKTGLYILADAAGKVSVLVTSK
jgi:hypothetical protein